ncbi:MAG TPA: twin-arginine translocation signal domain-containing protein [Ilumatobacteraceae bacterium]|nr:twin-arginine translocation signal domain-containing protein [Ilumatobacteraceae bacterium]
MTTRHDPARISRRAVLGTAAAAGATLGGAGNVLAAPPPTAPGGPANDPFFVSEAVDVPEVVPAPTTPGTRYVSVAGIDFKPFRAADAAEYDSLIGELTTSSVGGFTAPVSLPHGARITEMVVYAVRPAAGSSIVRLVCHRSSLADANAFVIVASVNTSALAASPQVRTYTVPIGAATNGAVVDETAAAYFVILHSLGGDPHEVWGVRIGYVTADAGRFFPIDPIRAYDSRAALPEPGLLEPNASRTILVKDSRANASGAVLTPDVVPVAARAIACNLTVTGTTGPNFLALTPGDAGSFTASAINWSGADQSVANGLIVKLDGNRFVKVWCGDQTGSTHVILDVNGYWR